MTYCSKLIVSIRNGTIILWQGQPSFFVARIDDCNI